MRTRRAAAAITLGLGTLLTPSVVAASCAEFPPIGQHLDQAEVVLVGTVIAVTNEERTALVAVEEIWRGPELPAEVRVYGALEDLGFTSGDRYFEAGVRYLLAPSFSDGRLEDNACTATRQWSEDLAAYRPSTTATRLPAETESADGLGAVPVAILVVGLAAAIVAGVSLAAFRSRPS
jgi:hypothetical protein